MREVDGEGHRRKSLNKGLGQDLSDWMLARRLSSAEGKKRTTGGRLEDPAGGEEPSSRGRGEEMAVDNVETEQ